MKEKIDEKIEMVEDEDYEGLSSKNIIFAVIFISVISFALIMAFQQNPNQNLSAAKQDGDNLIIKELDVKTDAKFYFYTFNEVKIQFFTVLGIDNQPRIAFDACDVCYEAKKGYIHENPFMKCQNCGKTFPVDAIGTENLVGGCWPSYLPMTVSSGNILIKISDVTQKSYMFA